MVVNSVWEEKQENARLKGKQKGLQIECREKERLGARRQRKNKW